MKSRSGLYYGYREGRLTDVLTDVLTVAPNCESALVRAIDSQRDPVALLQMLAKRDIRGRLIPQGVWITSKDLTLAHSGELFTGFDEIWIFGDVAPDVMFDPQLGLTTDEIQLREAVPDQLEEALEGTSCIAALGDGCGLNYATSDERIVDVLLP